MLKEIADIMSPVTSLRISACTNPDALQGRQPELYLP